MRKFIIIIAILLISNSAVYADTSSSFEMEVTNIGNQFDKPWCAAFAVSGAIETQMRAEGMAVPEEGFSAAWLNVLSVALDLNASIHNMLSIVVGDGLSPESECLTSRYVHSKELPRLTEKRQEVARKYRIWDFKSIEDVNVDTLKAILSSSKVILISTKTNMARNWNDGDSVILDRDVNASLYHATYLIGYDDNMVVGEKTGFLKGLILGEVSGAIRGHIT